MTMGAPWWRGVTLYQIYPLSFCDSNGDGWGDLAGVTQHLDHVASLGVDGIWLSPFYRSPMRDFGYDCEDHCSVDPRLGTMDDADELIDRAHAMGLKVLVDQVYTYTSNRHRWFEESRSSHDNPRHDWYVWADARPDGTPPNNWQTIFGGPAWEWDPGRRQYYLTHFDPEMPHLNVNLPAVQDELLEVARFWLARGVDGFRLDVINLATVDPELRDNPPSGRPFATPDGAQLHLHDRSWPATLGFVRRLQSVVEEVPGRHTLAEFTLESALDRSLELLGPGCIDTAYFVIGAETRPLSPAAVRTLVDELASAGVWPTWAFGNHDVMRPVTRCASRGAEEDPRFAELLIAILVCLRGNLLVYQGEELGLPHADVPLDRLRDPEGIRFHSHGMRRDGARTPLPWTSEPPEGAEPWLPYDDRHLSMSVERQRHDPASTLARTTAWLQWRRTRAALSDAPLTWGDSEDQVLVWRRSTDDGEWWCLFDLGGRGAHHPLTGADAASIEISSAGVRALDDGVELPPFGAAVLWVGAKPDLDNCVRK